MPPNVDVQRCDELMSKQHVDQHLADSCGATSPEKAGSEPPTEDQANRWVSFGPSPVAFGAIAKDPSELGHALLIKQGLFFAEEQPGDAAFYLRQPATCSSLEGCSRTIHTCSFGMGECQPTHGVEKGAIRNTCGHATHKVGISFGQRKPTYCIDVVYQRLP